MHVRKMERVAAKTIPIFAMSANAFLDDIRRSRDAGMNEHSARILMFFGYPFSEMKPPCWRNC